ncbi:hypothetical protein [Escherichia sp. E4742]|nr:hypothetical protein [Escherichia sp. E4742]
MAVPSPAEVSAGCRYLAPAFSPGTGIIPAYPGAGESGAVVCPG